MSESLSKEKYVHSLLFQLLQSNYIELKLFFLMSESLFQEKKETHIFIPNSSVELYRAKMLFEPFDIIFMLKNVGKCNLILI